jgi:parallel beta-helix repeat protein
VRGLFRDLYIHDTAATGFGCDFLQDTVVSDVLAVHCGRLNNGDDMGGAGIGIGIGGWGPSERFSLSTCTTLRNGTNGIFVELQKQTWTPPHGIRIVGCHAEGNRFGISDWGAEGLVVSACTMTGNHQAGYDVSALGTSSVAGRGGIVTGCVIENNVWDGVAVGNTPGPYRFTGNRVSRNGRYGYWQHNLAGGRQEPAGDMTVDGNEFSDNALDGIFVDSAVADPVLAGNRVRNNGRQAERRWVGNGAAVSYGPFHLTDTGAEWQPDGHVGKLVESGAQQAVVVANTATRLTLAPVRPGAATAWPEGTPPAHTPYELPDAPDVRAGITLAAAVRSPTINDNRTWDNRERPTQTHGLRITRDGTCESGWVHDNDLDGNAVAATSFDTEPAGGRWHHNDGCP